MSTKQGYLKERGSDVKLAPKTMDTLVKDTARNRALSASLLNLAEKECLGYPPFATTENYAVGDKVFYDRQLWKFTQAHQAGAWNSAHVVTWSVEDEVEELMVQIATKAPLNGSAPNLSVGSAKKLESEEPVKESFFSRPTGGRDAEISNGNAQWQGVGGNSVKFNQLISIPVTNVSKSNEHVTFTDNRNGSFTIVSDGSNDEFDTNADTFALNIVKDHKLLFLFGGSNTTYILRSTTSDNIGVGGQILSNAIITAPATRIERFKVRLRPNKTINKTFYVNVIDLTAMGIDNLTTVAQVEAWLAENVGLQEYYAYTEGEVVNVNLTGIESVNRNLLDANGDAQIIGEYDDTYGNYYGIKGTHGTITFTDKLGNATTITPDAEGKFYLDVEGTLHVADKDDTTIVFLWYDGSETDYVEHEVSIGRLDLTHIWGKKNGTGDLIRVWPTGAPGLDDLKDLLYLEDGVVVAKRFWGEVDFGQITDWELLSNNTFRTYQVPFKGYSSYLTPCIHAKYKQDTSSYLNLDDKCFVMRNDIKVFVRDTSCVDAATFKTANNGVMLYFELATPETYTDLVYMGSEYFEDGTPVALPVNYEADNWGIENILPKNTSTILTAKPEITCLYSMDLAEMVDTQRQQIENLDEKKANTNGTYSNMSVGSADNLSGKNPVDIEFTAHKTGAPNIVAKGLAQLNEVRGTSLVWNQLMPETLNVTTYDVLFKKTVSDDGYIVNGTNTSGNLAYATLVSNAVQLNHKYVLIGRNCSNDCYIGWNAVGSIKVQHGGLIHKVTTDAQKIVTVNVPNGSSVSNVKIQIVFVDLTLMFGEGKEPSSVEEFEKLYPLPYYAYNVGSIVNNNAEGLEVIGFNQWDEEWELGAYSFDNGAKEGSNVQIRCKNKIRVFPNTSYYFKSSDSMWAAIYDSNGTYIGGLNSRYSFGNQVITTPNNACFVTFWCRSNYGTTYKNDICINLSNASRNGTYEPYKRVVIDLNIPTLTGKKIVDGSTDGQESVVIYQDTVGEQVVTGMKGVGTAYDVIQQDADKVLRRARKVYKVLDIGELNWVISSGTGDKFVVYLESRGYKTGGEIICAKYNIGPALGYSDTTTLDKIIGKTTASSQPSKYIYIKDSNYSDVETFKAAMLGVPLIIELETPEEYILDTPIVNNYEEDGDGVERRLPEDTSSVVNAPLPLKVTYPIDAVGQLLDMPKDYDTVGSLDNLCSALATTLSSALNGTLAITRGAFDTTTNKYTFTCTFTPNA